MPASLSAPALHGYRPRLLVPVPASAWRDPSQAVPRDALGNPVVRTRFRLLAVRAGRPVWSGWLEDRDEADALLLALRTGRMADEPALWDLPGARPEILPPLGPGRWPVPGGPWSPDIGPADYRLLSVTDLTATGSLLTYTSNADWDPTANMVESLAGGAGGAFSNSFINATGSGGGAYACKLNVLFATPGTTTADYRIGTGGAARSTSGDGNAGTDTWFGGTAVTGSICGAKAGLGGSTSGVGAVNGGTGGPAASSVGDVKWSGGRGGNITVNGNSATGGGSAAADNGNGNNGGDTGSTGTQTAGGADPSGPGGAGGDGKNTGLGINGGSGVSYGGAGGAKTGTNSSGAGAPGLIRITYEPLDEAGLFRTM